MTSSSVADLTDHNDLRYDPDAVHARYSLAILYEQLGNTSAGLEQYRHILALQPDFADTKIRAANLRAK